ncbi:MAG: bifunctional diguanylate cyclase/phosphodiesterase [Acidimicrobiales bacterium]|jgi:diguanylate cyclase (GGDEF)-like protein
MAIRSQLPPVSPKPVEASDLPPSGIAFCVQALQTLFDTSAVLFVPCAASAPDRIVSLPAASEVPPATARMFTRTVFSWLAAANESVGKMSLIVDGTEWHLVLSESRAESGERIGAIALARRDQDAPPWSPSEISCVRTLANLCGTAIGSQNGDPEPPSRIGLDALVTRVAVKLMPVSAATMHESLEWVLHDLTDYFEVDVSFLRRTDFDRETSVLVAEWPRRMDVPDPDPLGEVPFGADPIFDATRDLKEPFTLRPTDSTDTYQERVREGSGIDEVSVAVVPLIRTGITVGVLGFVKFGDRSWNTAEMNALQAIASLMLQLQARIDAEEQLRHQSNTDELTGLPNRRALLEELRRRVADRSSPAMSLLFLDLDRFHAVNAFLGHDAGDRFLITVAGRLRDTMGTGDFVARLVGDEFAYLLERPSVELEALAVADRVMERVADPVEINGHHVSRTASVGISFSSDDSVTVEDLLGQADAALNLSKAQGGNQAVIFDAALRASVKERADTELLLRNAIEGGGLLLYYQPEVDLRTGELLAVEALVRWNHPERGVLPAGSFITVAEETGLIADLGRWVLEEACRQMAEWRDQYPMLHITMRVNVSPAQLATRNIVQLVKDCLDRNHLPGRLLCLEITEHAVVQDVEQTVSVLRDLKALGITLAIDDFGTGYSSMSQLRNLPVDALKIDQTFVSGLGIDGGDRAIVDVTVRLAQSFGLEVIAEGVETVELVRELLDVGCFRAQGYLLSRPQPPVNLEAILRNGAIHPSVLHSSCPTVTSSAIE